MAASGVDSLIGGHLRKETQELALQQVSHVCYGWIGWTDEWMDEWMRKSNAAWMDVAGDIQGDSNLMVNRSKNMSSGTIGCQGVCEFVEISS